jgi:hypothetical protein
MAALTLVGISACAAAPTPAQEANLGTQGAQEEACIVLYKPSDSAITQCRHMVQAKFGHGPDAAPRKLDPVEAVFPIDAGGQ